MSENQNVALSRSAIETLRAELEHLKSEGRQKMAQRLLEARELGDISENSEYESAKQDQAFLEGRILKLEHLLANAVEREALTGDPTVADVGVLVTVRDADDPSYEESYLVAESEERVTGASVLSPRSPLGQALLGKGVGDKVTYKAPGGTFTYEVVSLELGA